MDAESGTIRWRYEHQTYRDSIRYWRTRTQLHVVTLKIGVSLPVTRFNVFHPCCSVLNGRPFFIHESLNCRGNTYNIPTSKRPIARNVSTSIKTCRSDATNESKFCRKSFVVNFVENLKQKTTRLSFQQWLVLSSFNSTKHCSCAMFVIKGTIKYVELV